MTAATETSERIAAAPKPADDKRFYRLTYATLILGAILCVGMWGLVSYTGSVTQGNTPVSTAP